MNDKYDDCYIELNEGLEEYPIFFQSFINKNKSLTSLLPI